MSQGTLVPEQVILYRLLQVTLSRPGQALSKPPSRPDEPARLHRRRDYNVPASQQQPGTVRELFGNGVSASR